MNTPVWFLPGFLGSSSHFGEVLDAFPTAEVISPLNFLDAHDLPAAGKMLAAKALAEGLRPHLIGYSLGGRWAFHAALAAPGAFASVTTISAHPGLPEPEERRLRIEDDHQWATLLRHDWEEFWGRWNLRGVLANSTAPVCPHLTTAEREAWAQLQEQWSTGRQNYLPPLLEQLPLSLMCAVGEKDHNYVELLKTLPASAKRIVIPQAGHRVPLDNPSQLVRELKNFMESAQ